MISSIKLGSLELPLKDYSQSQLIITNIEGLGPVPATINITPYASGDGGVFNSSRQDSRNIVVTMKLGKEPNMEYNRRKVYNACPIGHGIRVIVNFEEGESYRKSYYGYVESIDCDYFGEQEGIQVSIVCPSP